MSSDLNIVIGERPPGAQHTLAEYVLLRLRGLYGAGRVTRELSSEPAIRLWLKEAESAFAKRRFTREQVDAGLEVAVNTLKWPPLEIPELVRLCSPVRDYQAAYREAQRQAYRRANGSPDEWSHPAIYWAADRFGWFEVRNTSWEQAERRWSEVMSMVLTWPEWPAFDLVKLPTQHGLQTRTVQAQELRRMREILRTASGKNR